MEYVFCLYMIHTLMHIQKHQPLDNRLPGLLLQTAFYRCCETTRVHFMVLGRVNRTAWGTKLLLTAVWASLVDCSYQFMSLTDGTALFFEFEWVLYPAFGSSPVPTTHPTPSLPPPCTTHPTPLPPSSHPPTLLPPAYPL